MLQPGIVNQDRIIALIRGNFTRKEFRNLTIDQMLQLGKLVAEEGIWIIRKNAEEVNYKDLSNEVKFECMFDPQFKFAKVLDRIDIYTNKKGEVFFSERNN